MTYIKTTASIKPAPEADEDQSGETKLVLATSELMKIIAMSMAGHPIRNYIGDMIEKLVVGGVLIIESKDEEVEDDMPERDEEEGYLEDE